MSRLSLFLPILNIYSFQSTNNCEMDSKKKLSIKILTYFFKFFFQKSYHFHLYMQASSKLASIVLKYVTKYNLFTHW